jgi:LacI family transcriptional regulator
MVTIQDIANKAQVSAMTVSRVITGSAPEKVSAATRARVLKIAEELGYTPNIAARALRAKCSFLFGLVVSGIDHSFTASIVEGIQEVAMSKDYSCLLYITRGNTELEIRSLEALVAKQADGIIWVPNKQIPVCIPKLSQRVKIVQLLNKEVDHLPAVLVDQVRGQYLATSYLTQLGHRYIGYVMKNDRHSRDRLIGHRQALADAGIYSSPVINLENDWSGQVDAIRLFLTENPQITAIAASTDMLAWCAIQAAGHLGRRIPDDLSITGFDNIELATQVIPALTSVDQPKKNLGQVAMQVLTRYIQGEEVEDVTMQTQLVVRNTTANNGSRSVALRPGPAADR